MTNIKEVEKTLQKEKKIASILFIFNIIFFITTGLFWKSAIGWNGLKAFLFWTVSFFNPYGFFLSLITYIFTTLDIKQLKKQQKG